MHGQKQQSSPFVDAAAVDAWDAWFRWRESGELRDLSIESTWLRVATALAEAEPAARQQWCQRFFDAQAAWHILLDERVLAHAGTGHMEWPADPVAVLNLPSFVTAPYTAGALLDAAVLREATELGVRCLDDICLLRGDGAPQLGVIGIADAFALLGIDYVSDAARRRAALIAKTIAEACLAASVWLARERGARVPLSDERKATFCARGLPQQLIDDAAQFGLRHEFLTAIRPQRRLALFANRVTDALDPLDCTYVQPAAAWAARPDRTRGYAATIARIAGGGDAVLRAVAPVGNVPAAAQRALRLAMQPWIDAPIDYPLCMPAR